MAKAKQQQKGNGTKASAPAIEPEVLEAKTEEVALIETDGSQIRQFITNIAAFFRGAAALERDAKARLTKALELKAKGVPKDEQADEAIQVFIKESRGALKKAEDYWSITTVFHGVHRKLTTARGRTTDPNQQAIQIGQDLHNRYAEEERRRAAAEQERLNREAEERARQDRERELQELEAQAIAREEQSPELSEREAQFVDFYVLEVYRGSSQGNAQVAAQRAGYRDPMKAAARLISLAKIQAAVKAKQEAENIRRQKEAIARQPVEPYHVETVRPKVSRGPGLRERVTHAAEVLDEQKLIAAIIAGGHGIPNDVLTVNQSKLNEYAASLEARINAWPGVRYVKKTTNY